MRRTMVNKSEQETRKIRPALTPEADEAQMISLAKNLARKQLIEGTASAQVITHYLKLGSSREQLEQEKLRKEQDLIEAKKENLISSKAQEELYANALNAMRTYQGGSDPNGEDPNV